MEAPQRAREPTGTNGPTLNTNPPPPADATVATPGRRTKRGGTQNWGKRNTLECSQPLYESHPTHTPGWWHHHKAGETHVNTDDHSCGGHSVGETPSNIPNLEAKPNNADGTAPGRVWESRTPPQHTQPGRGENHCWFSPLPPYHTHTRTHAVTPPHARTPPQKAHNPHTQRDRTTRSGPSDNARMTIVRPVFTPVVECCSHDGIHPCGLPGVRPGRALR